jgi:hypothetical protein
MVPLLKERNIRAKFLVRDVKRAREKYADLVSEILILKIFA